jgi:hypothetical protein
MVEDWLDMCEQMSFGQNKTIVAHMQHERYQQSRIRALRELVRLGYRAGDKLESEMTEPQTTEELPIPDALELVAKWIREGWEIEYRTSTGWAPSGIARMIYRPTFYGRQL